MGFFITLSFFDRKIGPTIFYFYPIDSLEKYLVERITNIMDQIITEGFFTYSFDSFYSINYYFDINSTWARGFKESLMISAIFDERISIETEKAILTLCIEFSEWIKSKDNIFTGFYKQNPQYYENQKNKKIIDENFFQVKSWVKEFYKAVLEEVQEKFTEENIISLIEDKDVIMTLKYLLYGPLTVENLKKWYLDNFPEGNFYRLIIKLIKNQMIVIPNIGKSKNPPFNIYIAEDLKKIVNLIELKNKLLKRFIKKHQMDSPEVIEKKSKDI
jgi:hypothetical protein